jgi:outer membrane receptor protein involved in Fe transport
VAWGFSGACAAGMPDSVRPSTAMPLADGWTARFFVNPAEPRAATGLVDIPVSPGVNARLSRRIARGTTLSLDVRNLFDRPDDRAPANALLQPPRDGRGIGIQLKKTF